MVAVKLNPMDIVKRASNDYSWKVLEVLGAGGFGCVYKVIQVNSNGVETMDSKVYAMKTELKTASRNSSRLKIEKNVMHTYAKSDMQNRVHFPEMIDSGQTVALKWIVMTLVGPSIDSLKVNGFSLSTALRCGIQTGKSIYDLHTVGFLHRDIKPGNFCAGIGPNTDVIYILDFGLARLYKQKDGTLRPPRPLTKMIGTPRYCARASHMNQELSRKDDFESWYFMLLDMMDHKNGIQWRGKSRDTAFAMKKKLFENPSWIISVAPVVPEKFNSIAQYINKLDYSAPCDFDIIRGIIVEFAQTHKFTLKENFDWVLPNKNIKMPNAAPAAAGAAAKSKDSADASAPSKTSRRKKKKDPALYKQAATLCDLLKNLNGVQDEEGDNNSMHTQCEEADTTTSSLDHTKRSKGTLRKTNRKPVPVNDLQKLK